MKMREYSHEEFCRKVEGMTEEEIMEFSRTKGGYPIFFRMSLDERLQHIPFIQTGSACIIVNQKGEILLQERADKKVWGLPGGCQELGETLEDTVSREVLEETGIVVDMKKLITIKTVSGPSRKNSYPSGDIVYNNTTLFLYKVEFEVIEKKQSDEETIQLKFFKIDSLPDMLMDKDLIDEYKKYLKKQGK